MKNTTLVSSAPGRREQPPVLTNADETAATQPMERHAGGGEHGASLTRGLSEVLFTLGKLSAITVLVLLLQKGFARLQSVKPKAVPG